MNRGIDERDRRMSSYYKRTSSFNDTMANSLHLTPITETTVDLFSTLEQITWHFDCNNKSQVKGIKESILKIENFVKTKEKQAYKNFTLLLLIYYLLISLFRMQRKRLL